MVDEFQRCIPNRSTLAVALIQFSLEQCRLVVVDGPDAGKQLTLDKPIVRIGSNSKNDLVLSDNTVSRFHCEIRHVRDEYLFVDRQSTNGCYFGDLRLVEGSSIQTAKFWSATLSFDLSRLLSALKSYRVKKLGMAI